MHRVGDKNWGPKTVQMENLGSKPVHNYGSIDRDIIQKRVKTGISFTVR